MKPILFGIVTALILLAQGENASADVYWNNNNGSGDRSWSVSSNWNGGAPTSGDTALIMGTEWSISLANMPVVSTANNFANQIYVRSGAGLSIAAGGLLNATDLITGINGNSNVVDISGGGQVTLSGILNLGAGGYDGKVNISNGSLLANNLSINTTGGAGMNIGRNGSFVLTANAANLDKINYWVAANAITANSGAAGWRINVDTTQAGKIVLTALSGYSSWARINVPSGTAADDYDGDGVSNGLEYVLGGGVNTSDSTKLPQLSISDGNVIFTFVRDQASINGSTTVQIEVGSDLTSWSLYEVGIEPVIQYPNDVVLNIYRDTPAIGKDTITLSRPRSGLPTKLFARLSVGIK